MQYYGALETPATAFDSVVLMALRRLTHTGVKLSLFQ
jgi:hypothetical protein